jgi:hypothetical protein
MRRLLNQAANAAARTKGSIFEIVYRRSVPRLGHNQAIGAIAHRQCRLIWLILHQGVRYGYIYDAKIGKQVAIPEATAIGRVG